MRIIYSKQICLAQQHLPFECFQVALKGTYFYISICCPISLWNNSLIRISILGDYWLGTMRDGHKHLLIYLDKCMGVYLNPLLRA